MPADAKPLFRPDALRPGLAAVALPASADAARAKLARWAKLLASPAGLAKKETELRDEFLFDVFRDLLGYTSAVADADGETPVSEVPDLPPSEQPPRIPKWAQALLWGLLLAAVVLLFVHDLARQRNKSAPDVPPTTTHGPRTPTVPAGSAYRQLR